MILLALQSWAAPISGVVQGPDGLGVEGVQVVVYDQRLTYGTGYTDASGNIALDLPPGPWRVRLVPPQGSDLAETWVPGTLDICTAEVFELGQGATPSFAQSLAGGAGLTGALVDSDGAPVVGATVTARTALASARAVARRAVSDTEGRFAIRGIPADSEDERSGTFFIEVEAQGSPVQYLGATYATDEAERYTLAAGEEQEVGSHVLLPGIGVAGTVSGPDGPVLIGDVTAYSPSQLVQVPIVDGTYEAWGLPPGTVLTWARAPGLGTTYLPDSDRPGERVAVEEEGAFVDGLDLTLPLESRLSGRLEAPTPLAGASVRLLNSDGTVAVAAACDDGGGFVVDALHPGTYTLDVFAADEGYLDGPWVDAAGVPRSIVVGAGDQDLGAIPLVPGARLSGVAHTPSGEPVYGATISAVEVSTGMQQLALTDREGAYTIRGLGAGTWDFTATYTSWCSGDPDFLGVFYPNERLELFRVSVELEPGALVEWDPELPADHDQDGMADDWERDNGLDPTRDDADEDPDEDGYTNREEYLLGSDPQAGRAAECGCHTTSPPVSLAFLGLGLFLRRRSG
jgi:hypothetical protein